MVNHEALKLRLRLSFGLFLFFLDALCFTQYGPFFPTEALSKGSSITMVGIIIGSFDITAIAASLLLMLTEIQNNKLLFICGASFRGFSTVCFGFAGLISDVKMFNTMCIVIRCAMGLISIFLWVCGIPYLVSLQPQHAGVITGQGCWFFKQRKREFYSSKIIELDNDKKNNYLHKTVLTHAEYSSCLHYTEYSLE